MRQSFSPLSPASEESGELIHKFVKKDENIVKMRSINFLE